MIHNISWADFFTTVVIAVLVYYAMVVYACYRQDLGQLVNRKPMGAAQAAGRINQPSLFEPQDPEFRLPPNDSAERMVYDCVDEVNAFLEQAKAQRCTKENLIPSLQRILKKYPQVKTSDYKESLSNVLITQCEHVCSVRLSAEDMVVVWEG